VLDNLPTTVAREYLHPTSRAKAWPVDDAFEASL